MAKNDATQVLVRDYLDAFRLAHPDAAAPVVQVRGGWITIRDGHHRTNHRAEQVAELRDRLLSRATCSRRRAKAKESVHQA